MTAEGASRLLPPWTDEQVRALNAYQQAGYMHPFTCPNRSDGQHQNDGSDLGTLVAGTDGWWCRDCEYTQRWAHEFMADPRSSRGVSGTSSPSEVVTRLFGLPGSENLETDLGSAYEMQIEPYADEADRGPRTIEEWTVLPAGSTFRSADSIVEWLCEDASDDAPEGWYDSVAHLDRDPVVLAAAEALRVALIERSAPYWIADKRVALHLVTWDDDGEPLVDGERLYRPRSEQEADRG